MTINGQWQPFVSTSELAVIPREFNDGVGWARDLASADFGRFARKAFSTIGRVDGYSDVLQSGVECNLNRHLFFLAGEYVHIVILSIHSSFMPNHFQYGEVAQYGSAWMGGRWSLTVLVQSQEDSPPPLKIDSGIQDILQETVGTKLFV
jgi:hypothetical protein